MISKMRLPIAAAALVLGLPLGPWSVASPTASRAEASEFYSRRRVNGVWQTGSFPKAEVDAELKRAGAGSSRARSAQRSDRRPKSARPQTARPVAAPEATSSIAVRSAPANTAHMEKLRRAMEVKAREVLASLSADHVGATPTDSASVEVELAPTSITYDYAGRIKTTTYPGDIVVREPLLAANPKPAAPEHNVAATRPAAP